MYLFNAGYQYKNLLKYYLLLQRQLASCISLMIQLKVVYFLNVSGLDFISPLIFSKDDLKYCEKLSRVT